MSKRTLTSDEAASIVKPGERVHTFRSTGIALIGCDWDRKDILEAIEKHATEIAGPMAMGMKHGLCIHVDGQLFVETIDNPEAALDESARLGVAK